MFINCHCVSLVLLCVCTASKSKENLYDLSEIDRPVTYKLLKYVVMNINFNFMFLTENPTSDFQLVCCLSHFSDYRNLN